MLGLASCAPDTVQNASSGKVVAGGGAHVAGAAGSAGAGGSGLAQTTFAAAGTQALASSTPFAGAGASASGGTFAASGGGSAAAGAGAGKGASVGAAGSGGRVGSAGAAGTPTSATAGATSAAAGSGTVTAVADSDTDMLREACVEEINMYRAMRMDAPALKRATPEQEMCSDQGTKSDGDSMSPHGFFRMQGTCIGKVGLSAQDSCPGYPVGGFGSPTVLDALKGCLKQMWAEGEPPQGREACTQDAAGCFEKYGHWLNMSNPKATAVSCSFYKMKDGKSWWMSQDFVISWF